MQVGQSNIRSAPKLRSVDEIARDTVSGQAHLRAWTAIMETLDEVDPRWADDVTKSPVENAVAAIRRLAKR